MKRILLLLTAASAFSTLSIQLLAPFYAIFVDNLGGGLILAGGAWAVYHIGSGLSMMIAGGLEDKYRAERFLLFGFSLRVLGTTGYFFVHTPLQLILVQIVHGLAHAFIAPGHSKIYAKYLDGGKEASEWAIPGASKEISIGIGGLAGGIVLAYYSFTALFTIMLAAHLISFICAFKVMRSVELPE